MSRNPLSLRSPVARKLPFHRIVESPTPVARLERIGSRYGHSQLYIKREDLTHETYGGNKVRNLEFLIGAALAQGKKKLVTIVPKGSNFTAALAAHGVRAGLEVHLSQFVAVENPQIESHYQFSKTSGARDRTYRGVSSPARAAIDALLESYGSDSAYVSPGGSSTLGAMGHANAFMEFVTQLRQGSIPIPDALVVGAGTCGTTAGLLAGIHLSGLPIEVIGVRCAERIICHRPKILRLASSVLRELGVRPPYEFRFRLVESPLNAGYGKPTASATEVMEDFNVLEGITLDTTYTSKVALFLKRALEKGEFQGRKVLYWNTFSPAAMRRPS